LKLLLLRTNSAKQAFIAGTQKETNIAIIPLALPEFGITVSEDLIEIRGELYGPNLSQTKTVHLLLCILVRKIPK
tara:strand:+ start:160 stop:384 length:225 start_codon:yes stop_codon:yes gene_type:complete